MRMTSARLRQVALDNPRAGYEALLDVSRAFCIAARLEPARLAQTDTLLANALLAYVDVVGEDRDGARLRAHLLDDLDATIGLFDAHAEVREPRVVLVERLDELAALVEEQEAWRLLSRIDARKQAIELVVGHLKHELLGVEPCFLRDGHGLVGDLEAIRVHARRDVGVRRVVLAANASGVLREAVIDEGIVQAKG